MSGFAMRMPELQYTWEGVKIADHRSSGFTTQAALEQYNARRQALQKQAPPNPAADGTCDRFGLDGVVKIRW